MSERRTFLKGVGSLFAASVALQAAPTIFKNSKEKRYGMVIDLTRCVGCQSCSMNCSIENNSPVGQFRTIVAEFEVSGEKNAQNADAFIASLPRICNHCAKPACIDVCPTGASHQRKNGIVKVESVNCISCANCIEACPYDARFLNLDNLLADKCTFCDHRLRVGLLPSCVETCVGGSRIIGDLHDENSNIRQFLKTHDCVTLVSDLNTEPRVFYYGLHEKIANRKTDDKFAQLIDWDLEYR